MFRTSLPSVKCIKLWSTRRRIAKYSHLESLQDACVYFLHEELCNSFLLKSNLVCKFPFNLQAKGSALLIRCRAILPVPVAARSKAYGRSPAQFVGSIPAAGHGCLSLVSVVCCRVEISETS